MAHLFATDLMLRFRFDVNLRVTSCLNFLPLSNMNCKGQQQRVIALALKCCFGKRQNVDF